MKLPYARDRPRLSRIHQRHLRIPAPGGRYRFVKSTFPTTLPTSGRIRSLMTGSQCHKGPPMMTPGRSRTLPCAANYEIP